MVMHSLSWGDYERVNRINVYFTQNRSAKLWKWILNRSWMA